MSSVSLLSSVSISSFRVSNLYWSFSKRDWFYYLDGSPCYKIISKLSTFCYLVGYCRIGMMSNFVLTSWTSGSSNFGDLDSSIELYFVDILLDLVTSNVCLRSWNILIVAYLFYCVVLCSSDGVLFCRVMLNHLMFLRFFRFFVVNTCFGKLRFIWCSDPFSDAISRLFLFMLILSINKDLCLNLSFLASYILLFCVFNPAK